MHWQGTSVLDIDSFGGRRDDRKHAVESKARATVQSSSVIYAAGSFTVSNDFD